MSNEDEEKIGKESTPNTVNTSFKKYCFISGVIIKLVRQIN